VGTVVGRLETAIVNIVIVRKDLSTVAYLSVPMLIVWYPWTRLREGLPR
jgi:hypothetical protein